MPLGRTRNSAVEVVCMFLNSGSLGKATEEARIKLPLITATNKGETKESMAMMGMAKCPFVRVKSTESREGGRRRGEERGCGKRKTDFWGI